MFLLRGNPLLPVFLLSGAADLRWAALPGRHAACYRVSVCPAHPFPFPFPLLLRRVEQMVLIPMETLDAAEVSSLMPLLCHGNSLWSFWRREHTADYYLLFMTFKILLGLYFFLLFSSTFQPVPKIFGLKSHLTWEKLLFITVSYIILHSYRHLSTTYLPL